MSRITDNIDYVEARISEACKRSGRDRNAVQLIAVSKTKPVPDLMEALNYGTNVFGENKVQEIRDKVEAMGTDGIHWHMIGHLQANKVKYLIGVVELIHSVDNDRLAEEIEKQAAKHDTVMDVLCEVNMAGEDTKFGLKPEETMDFVKRISALKHIRIRGLMTIAPYTEEPESNRIYFKGLRELKDRINAEHIDGVSMDILSMGMTGDYEVAVEEGATLVRVGTGIFGERNYALKA